MAHDPEALAGSATARAILRDLDAAVAPIEANILEGRVTSIEQLRAQLGERTGLLRARRIVLSKLDAETKTRLGL